MSLLLALVACKEARVEGTVYRTTKDGTVIRNAGGAVGLIPYDSATRGELNSVCAQFRKADAPLSARSNKLDVTTQFDAYYRVEQQRKAIRDSTDAVLERFLIASAGSLSAREADAEGKFTFEKVEPGTYGLVSFAGYGENRTTWLRPITVKRGQPVSVDLNDAAQISYSHCYGRAPQF